VCLHTVSGKFIDEFQMACSKEARAALKVMMGHVHVYVTAACKEYFDKFRRHVYVTPKSYLSFIQGYKELYSRKWAYTQELAASIQVCGCARVRLAARQPACCCTFTHAVTRVCWAALHPLPPAPPPPPPTHKPNRLACKRWWRPRRTSTR
jgi:hypothetical protein